MPLLKDTQSSSAVLRNPSSEKGGRHGSFAIAEENHTNPQAKNEDILAAEESNVPSLVRPEEKMTAEFGI